MTTSEHPDAMRVFLTMQDLRAAAIPPAAAKAYLKERGIEWSEFQASGAEVSISDVPEPFKSDLIAAMTKRNP